MWHVYVCMGCMRGVSVYARSVSLYKAGVWVWVNLWVHVHECLSFFSYCLVEDMSNGLTIAMLEEP